VGAECRDKNGRYRADGGDFSLDIPFYRTSGLATARTLPGWPGFALLSDRNGEVTRAGRLGELELLPAGTLPATARSPARLAVQLQPYYGTMDSR
jgi:hypothetical protein